MTNTSESPLARAIALHQQGQLPEAAALYLEVLDAEPDNFDALHLLGVYAQQTGDNQAAYDLITRALGIDPQAAHAHTNLGIVLQQMQRHDDALQSHRKAIDIEPANQTALNNCGATLLKMRRPAEAVVYFERALAAAPAYAEAMGNLGNAYIDLRRYREALLCLDRALLLSPHFVAAHFNRGNALQGLNRIDEALAAYGRALEIEPDHVDAHFNRALCLLLSGEFERGWSEYEWRWEKASLAKDDRVVHPRDLPQPLWRGDLPLAGKTLLLYSEQGFGDTIQFCRYVPLLARRGASVIVRVQPALVSLLSSLDGAAAVIADDAPLPAFDFHCPLMSLPLAFAATPDSMVSALSYLTAPPDGLVWSTRLGVRSKPRIGLVWAGNPGHDNDSARSIALMSMLALVSDGAQYVSLQKQLRTVDRLLIESGTSVAEFSEALGDFADTAALIAAMDLVITVDTSVAHLAAAMGKPTWILLPYAPDWRWMLERSDSPWYPTVTLFRQSRSGDWDSVIGVVREAIAGFLPGCAV